LLDSLCAAFGGGRRKGEGITCPQAGFPSNPGRRACGPPAPPKTNRVVLKLALKYWPVGLAEMYRDFSKATFLMSLQRYVLNA